jgi:ubiquinone/menaquinone biosynthesis C-methylase UbiE
MILDVGCGGKSRGDINIDYKRFSDEQFYGRIIKSKLDVLADGQHLPFRDETFDKVLCYDVIEHVPRPVLLFSELLRVTRKDVIIRTPYKYGIMAKLKMHKNYFNHSWFARICKKFNVHITESVNTYVDVGFIFYIKIIKDMVFFITKEIL